MKNHLCVFALLWAIGLAHGQDLSASSSSYLDDPSPRIALALAQAQDEGKTVLLVFGADWCPDCRRFDEVLADPEVAARIASDLVLVKINIGRFDKNLATAQEYRVNPKKGIPALALFDPNGEQLYPRQLGETWTTEDYSKAFFLEFLNEKGRQHVSDK